MADFRSGRVISKHKLRHSVELRRQIGEGLRDRNMTLVAAEDGMLEARQISHLSDQHLLGQFKWAQGPAGLWGLADWITPMLETEARRRGLCLQDYVNHAEAIGAFENDDTTEETKTMNLDNMAALIREDITTCEVVHDLIDGKRYTYLITREMADEVQASKTAARGDWPDEAASKPAVVVRNRNGLTMGYVAFVHDEPQINLEAKTRYRYVVQVVDTEEADELEAEDKLIAEKLKDQKKRSVRDQVLASLGIQDTQQFLLEVRTEAESKSGK